MSAEIVEADLSGYTVRITRGGLGWSWEAEAPDGQTLTDALGRFSIERSNAEHDALRAIKQHAAQPPAIDGEELRRKVESDAQAEPEAKPWQSSQPQRLHPPTEGPS